MTPEQRPLNIFVSYRREDSQLHARMLAKELRAAVSAKVFIDIESVGLGEDFRDAIAREVSACDVALIIIGDDWLDGKTGGTSRRIDDEEDWVRTEVESALERKVPVVPILVEGAKMPGPDKLPDSIRKLAFKNGRELRSDDGWDEDIRKLIAGLPAPAAGESASRIPASGQEERASLDHVAAQAFIESMPGGRWTSYVDTSLAGGSRTGASAVAEWLTTKGEEIPGVWKVLTDEGEIPSGWAPTDSGLPQTPEDVRARLTSEGIQLDPSGRADESKRWTVEDAADVGVGLSELPETEAAETGHSDTLIVAARRAYPDYLLSSAYICQPGRSFRDEIDHLGFYAGREIKPHVATILHRRDKVEMSAANAAKLSQSSGQFDQEVARLIDQVLDPTVNWTQRREVGARHQVFLLSGPDDPETIRLPAPIHHGGKNAWTQSQRYAKLDQLSAGPADTTALG